MPGDFRESGERHSPGSPESFGGELPDAESATSGDELPLRGEPRRSAPDIRRAGEPASGDLPARPGLAGRGAGSPRPPAARGPVGEPRPEPPVAEPRPRPRFDLRSEFAALAAEPDPFALWERVEQLGDRFAHERRRPGARPRPAQPERPDPAGGTSALSGDLTAEPVGSPEPGAEPDLAEHQHTAETRVDQRPSGFSGPLLEERSVTEPQRPAADGPEGAPPRPVPPPMFHGVPPTPPAAQEPMPPGGPVPQAPVPPRGPAPQGEADLFDLPEAQAAPGGLIGPPPETEEVPRPARSPFASGPPPAGPEQPRPPHPGGPPGPPRPPLPGGPETLRQGPPSGPHPMPPSPPRGIPAPGPHQPGAAGPGAPQGLPQPFAPGAEPPSPPRGVPMSPFGAESAPPGGTGGPPPGPPPMSPGAAPQPPVAPQQPMPPPVRPAPPAPQRQAPPPPPVQQPQAPPPQPQRQHPPVPPAPPEPTRSEEPRPEVQRPAPPPPPDPYRQRADGGFGPMGSKSRSSSATGSGRTRRRTSWAASEEVQAESREREFSTGGYRPGELESGGRGPQFLVEADDLYDEYGGGRLVAPPVLGEAPPGYRDF
ncbi:hypothetical protein ACL03H_04870 [Saccharopolyspora sp. MS10]|uniref:hypothetical protein n=1 Tax=Saccharopolyspora sp. MS10 TaxID=3385973 RepID=UPI0039A04566